MPKKDKKPVRVTLENAEPGEVIYMYGDPSKRFVVDTKLSVSILLHEKGRDPITSRIGLTKEEFEGRWFREPRSYTYHAVREDDPIPRLDEKQFSKVLLSRLRQVAKMSLGDHAIDKMDLRVLRDDMTDSILFALRTEVMTERLSDREKTIIFEYPATWWEHLKKEMAPRWFLKRYPVKFSKYTQKIRFEEIALYPMLPAIIPDQAGECYFQGMFHYETPDLPRDKNPTTIRVR